MDAAKIYPLDKEIEILSTKSLINCIIKIRWNS
jgi:hypothetical protein